MIHQLWVGVACKKKDVYFKNRLRKRLIEMTKTFVYNKIRLINKYKYNKNRTEN